MTKDEFRFMIGRAVRDGVGLDDLARGAEVDVATVRRWLAGDECPDVRDRRLVREVVDVLPRRPHG